MESDLLINIRTFLAKSGMSPSYFGKVACGNSELVGRLEEGKTVTLATVEKVRQFIETRSKAGAA